MATSNLKSIYQGSLTIGDMALECHVLENNERIFSSSDVLKAFGLQNVETDQKNQPRVLKSFLTKIKFISIGDEELTNRLIQPIKFTRPGKGGVAANGYLAELIPEICNAVLKLSSKYMLPVEYMEAAEKSRILMNGFAKVGIIALVDEVTGFQEYRDKYALRDILDKYLRKEQAAWAKRFPDEFYREMFRLKGWAWKGMQVNRPSVVGKYTNAIVYARLAPGVLEELRSLNPPDDAGRRKSKHHQWLTDDIGHPALSSHIHAILAVMRLSRNWEQFKRNLQKAFPVSGDQIDLDLEDEA